MQMKALRSENFAKLSSNSSTREAYWVTSISAGTPAGYCLGQMRSMDFPPVYLSLIAAACLASIAGFGAILGNQAARGKRPRKSYTSRPMATGRIRLEYEGDAA